MAGGVDAGGEGASAHLEIKSCHLAGLALPARYRPGAKHPLPLPVPEGGHTGSMA